MKKKKFDWGKFATKLFDGLKFFGIFMATVIPSIMVFRFLFGAEMSKDWYNVFTDVFRSYTQNISAPECLMIGGVGIAGKFARKPQSSTDTDEKIEIEQVDQVEEK